MKYLRCIGLLRVVFLTVLVLPVGASSLGTWIDFSSLDTNKPYKVLGTLYLPGRSSSPCPAVVMIHGTGGIDSRGAFYGDSILNAGIAIFEADFRTGIYTSTLDRPKNETFLPMAFAALEQLRKLSSIDPNRIGIMGFSMGGGITLRTAVEGDRRAWMGDEKGFAAHAAFYPVCKPFIPKVEHRNWGDVITTPASRRPE